MVGVIWDSTLFTSESTHHHIYSIHDEDDDEDGDDDDDDDSGEDDNDDDDDCDNDKTLSLIAKYGEMVISWSLCS